MMLVTRGARIMRDVWGTNLVGGSFPASIQALEPRQQRNRQQAQGRFPSIASHVGGSTWHFLQAA